MDKWQDHFIGSLSEVLKPEVLDSSILPSLRRLVAAVEGKHMFYHLYLPPAQYYFYHTGLFPFCRLECKVDEAGCVLIMRAMTSFSAVHRARPMRRCKSANLG